MVAGSARRFGYRLLGRSFDYILHLRPAEWPIMAAHTSLGFLLGVGVVPALRGERLWVLLAALVIWVVLLNGGTLALNSAFDRDEGDIGYLKNPPPAPPGLAAFSLVLLAGGQVASLLLPVGFALAYAVCFGMSVAYSVPPLRFKAVSGVDWLINMAGFGTLTPYAGYAASGRPLDLTTGLVLLAFLPLFGALYPLTQLYQFEEDRARGDRTLAIELGMRNSLRLAMVMAAIAFALFAGAGVTGAWTARADGWLRWGGLLVAALAWGVVLARWLQRHARMSAAEHQAGMYAALRAWAITDVVVILGWGLYT